MALMLCRQLLRAAAPASAVRAVARLTVPCVLHTPTPLAVAHTIIRGVKTKSAIKKRFRVKPSGAITRLRSNRRHGMMSKSRNHINRLGRTGVVDTAGIRKRYLKLLQVSPLKGR